jgi:AraC-like DNA-binding protein
MRSKLDRISDWERKARECGYSPSKMAVAAGVTLRLLELFFQERFGVGPHDWILRLRMKDAATMLGAGHSVKSVADKLGFKQVSHFCREFKRCFGSPPARYTFAQLREGGSKIIRPFCF